MWRPRHALGAPPTFPEVMGFPRHPPETPGGVFMAAIRCSRCFRDREEAKKQPIADVLICGGCAMDVDAVIGFLEFCGYGLQLTIVPNRRSPALEGDATADEEPPKPPTEPVERALGDEAAHRTAMNDKRARKS